MTPASPLQIECPVPEQFKTMWNPETKKLETTMTESV
jgi:hypothetical protein